MQTPHALTHIHSSARVRVEIMFLCFSSFILCLIFFFFLSLPQAQTAHTSQTAIEGVTSFSVSPPMPAVQSKSPAATHHMKQITQTLTKSFPLTARAAGR